MVDNPNKTWKDVNPNFPAWEIAAYIPGEKHGTREVFEEKVLEAGCEATGAMEAMVDCRHGQEGRRQGLPRRSARTAAVDIDGDYTETLGRLSPTRRASACSVCRSTRTTPTSCRSRPCRHLEPSVETIASGEYPVSRPLFFYIKKAHIGTIPGLKEYAEFFVSERISGEDGPLAAYGLVPLPANEAEEVQNAVKNETTMGM
jgi:phosphate transport system substrate-binding protein